MRPTLPLLCTHPPVMMPMQMTSVLPLPTPAAVMVLAQWWIMKEPAIKARLVWITKPWDTTAYGASSSARITACRTGAACCQPEG